MIRWLKWIFGGGQWETDLLWQAHEREKELFFKLEDRIARLHADLSAAKERIGVLENVNIRAERTANKASVRVRNWSEFRNMAEQAEGVD